MKRKTNLRREFCTNGEEEENHQELRQGRKDSNCRGTSKIRGPAQKRYQKENSCGQLTLEPPPVPAIRCQRRSTINSTSTNDSEDSSNCALGDDCMRRSCVDSFTTIHPCTTRQSLEVDGSADNDISFSIDDFCDYEEEGTIFKFLPSIAPSREYVTPTATATAFFGCLSQSRNANTDPSTTNPKIPPSPKIHPKHHPRFYSSFSSLPEPLSPLSFRGKHCLSSAETLWQKKQQQDGNKNNNNMLSPNFHHSVSHFGESLSANIASTHGFSTLQAAPVSTATCPTLPVGLKQKILDSRRCAPAALFLKFLQIASSQQLEQQDGSATSK